MHRLFVAIRPPEPIRDLLIDSMDESPTLRWTGDEQLHLTLRFIGEVERPLASDIAGALGRIRYPAFELHISGVGRFDHANKTFYFDHSERVCHLLITFSKECPGSTMGLGLSVRLIKSSEFPQRR